jgi:anti-anti-sigma regulatory factor
MNEEETMSEGGAEREVRISESQLTRMKEIFNNFKQGNYKARLEEGFSDPPLADFEIKFNEFLKDYQAQAVEFHNQSMNLALGMAEALKVISELRTGHYEARVSQEMLESEDALIVSLGNAINEQMETIQQQQTAIHELSTPVLQIWDDVLALPIIGVVNSKRAFDIMERLLSEIVAKQSKFVILDITGVEVVDTKTADQFIKIIKSAKLIGSTCILTGIRPAVAQTLVELGVDLTSFDTLTNLKEGLKACLQKMRTYDEADPTS